MPRAFWREINAERRNRSRKTGREDFVIMISALFNVTKYRKGDELSMREGRSVGRGGGGLAKSGQETLRTTLLPIMKEILSPPFPDQHQEVPENCKGDNTDKNNVVTKETCVLLSHFVITRRLWLLSVRLGSTTSREWKGCPDRFA